ncbi:hypothetical protein K438DRAFT_1015809 [Mycena galopus ATCC 62051]|nr:hypothetical protein K438DRAFT_1015809 [Mycena galopus ATCC 62051]
MPSMGASPSSKASAGSKMCPALHNFCLRRYFHLIISRELSALLPHLQGSCICAAPLPGLALYHRIHVHVRAVALLFYNFCSIHLHAKRCPSLPKMCIQSLCLCPPPSTSRSKREIDTPHYAVSAWRMGRTLRVSSCPWTRVMGQPSFLPLINSIVNPRR